jgi:hypothetical protein
MQLQRNCRAVFPILIPLLICFCTVAAKPQLLRASSNLSGTEDSGVYPLSTKELVWEKTYGGTGDDRAFSVTSVDNNGLLIVGSSRSFNMNDTAAWAVRIDSSGNLVWNKTYFRYKGSEFRSALETTDGFLLVGNAFGASGNEDVWILKIDRQGNALWNKTFGGDNFNKVFSAAMSPDGFIFAGLTNSSEGSNSCAWLLKTDMGGNMLWNKTYQETEDSAFRAILVTMSGDYVIAGYSDSSGNGNYDSLLVKTDGNGTIVWNRTYGGPESDKAYALAGSNDGYMLAGETHSNIGADADAFVLNTDIEGRLVWNKTYGGANFDVANAIVPTENRGYLLVGFTFSYGQGQRDFWFFEIDNLGNLVWSRTYGREDFEEAYAAVEVGENEFVISGWTNSIGTGSYDFYVIRMKIMGSANGFDLGIVGYIVLALMGTTAISVFSYLYARRIRDKSKTKVENTNLARRRLRC